MEKWDFCAMSFAYLMILYAFCMLYGSYSRSQFHSNARNFKLPGNFC